MHLLKQFCEFQTKKRLSGKFFYKEVYIKKYVSMLKICKPFVPSLLLTMLFTLATGYETLKKNAKLQDR